MCIGLPMQLTTKDGTRGGALYRGAMENVDLSLTPEAQCGDYLLVFLGAARSVIDEAFAAQVLDALQALEAVAQGQSPDFAFADLANREPELPPHLQAALAAGRTTG
jgi:hydrogenase expression/formation protein HypC